MKKALLLLFLFSLFGEILNAQSIEDYYVSVKGLNLREAPNSHSSVLIKLNKYDNLKLIEANSSNWLKVSYQKYEGYVFSKYAKKGKAIVSTYSYRIGAKCRDGTTSSATGRGACSHHGGVSYWITSKKKQVRIED